MKQNEIYETDGCKRLLCAVVILAVLDVDSAAHADEAARFFKSDWFAEIAMTLGIDPIEMARKIETGAYIKPQRCAYHTSIVGNSANQGTLSVSHTRRHHDDIPISA